MRARWGRGTALSLEEKWQWFPQINDKARLYRTCEMGLVMKALCQLHQSLIHSGELGHGDAIGRPSQPWALWRPRIISSWIALGSLLSLSDAWEALGSPTFLSFQTYFLKVSLIETSLAASQTSLSTPPAVPWGCGLATRPAPLTAIGWANPFHSIMPATQWPK